MGGFNNPIIGGGGALVYPEIKSPNFSAGPPVVGWAILKNGNAFFGTVTITGSLILTGTTGEFTYDAAGNLRTAIVGQTVTDPLQGHTCYAGFSTFNGHGAVISLFSSTLDAQLWYADTGTSTQGALAQSVASAAGTDPFGNAFLQGYVSYGSEPVAQLASTSLAWINQSANFNTNPAIKGTGAGGVGQHATASLYSGTSNLGDPDVSITAASVDGGFGQAIIAPGAPPATGSTGALLEVQGTGHLSGILTPGAGTNSSGSAPSPGQSLVINGAAAQLSDLTRDYMLYLTFSGAGNVTVQAGPTSAVARTIYPTAACVAGAPYPVRIPAGWFVKCTGTGSVAIASQTVVGC